MSARRERNANEAKNSYNHRAVGRLQCFANIVAMRKD
jgi:hypothetical protein